MTSYSINLVVHYRQTPYPFSTLQPFLSSIQFCQSNTPSHYLAPQHASAPLLSITHLLCYSSLAPPAGRTDKLNRTSPLAVYLEASSLNTANTQQFRTQINQRLSTSLELL